MAALRDMRVKPTGEEFKRTALLRVNLGARIGKERREMTKFKKGEEAYTANGHQVFITQVLENGYLVNRMVWVGPDVDPELIREEEQVYMENLYSHPPLVALHDEALRLEKLKAKARQEISDLRAERDKLKICPKALTEGMAQQEAILRVIEFVKKPPTHMVIDVDYRRVEVGTVESRETKLVTLFGDSKGDLAWRINQYWDGSGNLGKCQFYSSETAAMEGAKALVQERLDALEKRGGTDWTNRHMNAIADAVFGVAIPASLVARDREHQQQKKDKAVAKAEKELKKAQAIQVPK